MASTALLVVSNFKHIATTLRAIEKYVGAVYIHLNIPSAATPKPVPYWGRMISQLYVDAGAVCSDLDMRILVGPIKQFSSVALTTGACLRLKRPIDMIFSDSHYPEVCETWRKRLQITGQTIYLGDGAENKATNDIGDYETAEKALAVYGSVVLGGTFDRIHAGHKILLTQAVLHACRRLVVGVTTAQLTQSKTLHELILPVEQRIREVREFLEEIDSSLQYEVVPIDDPLGPTKSDPDMDLIVVSAETLRGGQKVNEVRLQNKLRPLEIYCIEMVSCSVCEKASGPKEKKVSSSNGRMDLLGTRLCKPEPRPHLPATPYIIGLTGGIASGKSKMSQYFRELGALVMDCDKIAHEIYEPGQVCYQRVAEYFGASIIAADGRIDRRALGAIVFSDPAKLEALNNIVWPELMLEVKRRICSATSSSPPPRVVVIEAAVLLRAGWETECHEVWSMIVPPAEAVRRVMERNQLSEAEAHKRLASQLSNSEIVARSHVVFSSQWDAEFTREQAERAWKMLMQELNERERNTNSSNL